MSVVIPSQIEKCKGAMLATAIGDALGWPNEPCSKNRTKKPKVNDFFVEWTRSCREPRWHDEKIRPGEYSDDTQMTLSVARSIIAGDWENFLIEIELPFWLRYERGGGSALLKAARSISEKGALPWRSANAHGYFNAGGNGAAMRILPHVIAYANKPDRAALMQDVIRDTIITHGHPRAFLGATCYAYALDWLLRKETMLEYGELVSAVIDGQSVWGKHLDHKVFGVWLETASRLCGFDYAREWEYVCANMVCQLKFISSSLERGLILDDNSVLAQLECFSKTNGAGDVAILASIYLASRYASNPTLGIKVPAFSFGSDTDTIASITGGLLGMLRGTNWIPIEWRNVQDRDYLEQMAEILFFGNRQEVAKEETAKANPQDGSWRQMPIGVMRFIDSRRVPNGKNGFVEISQWRSVLGQTIYLKKFLPAGNGLQPGNQSGGQIGFDSYPQLVAAELKSQKTVSKSPTSGENGRILSQAQLSERQFILSSGAIEILLDKPEFRSNVTVGKVIKIIQAFLAKDLPVSTVAKRFDLDEGMVSLIKKCVK